MRLNRIILPVFILFAASCVDRFIPETTRYHEVLFIECLISDDPTALSTVKVSLTAPVVTEEGDKITYKPQGCSGAQVSIRRSDNIVYECTEIFAGFYPVPENLKVEPGKRYSLEVYYNGNFYESDWQELKPSPPVDSVSFRHVLQKLSEDGEAVDGYRFFVSTHDITAGPSYYRWSLDATYLYTVPYIATHVWDGVNVVPASNKLIRTCWKSKNIKGNYFAKTDGLTENRVIEAPLNFESQQGDELTMRYSLNVKQYRISQSAYSFWENVDKLLNQTGSLYQIQPFRIEGNIRCTSDSTLYVAGIFEIAGVATLRTFVNKPTEFPVSPVTCFLMKIDGMNLAWWMLPPGTFASEDIESKTFYTATQSCYDCRLRDGTLEKPPFWKDN